MSATGSAGRALLGLALSAFGSTVAAQYPEHHIRIVRHDLVVDVPRQEAVFNLWFSEAPDLTTLDEHGRSRLRLFIISSCRSSGTSAGVFPAHRSWSTRSFGCSVANPATVSWRAGLPRGRPTRGGRSLQRRTFSSSARA